jgi:hypothetical protein
VDCIGLQRIPARQQWLPSLQKIAHKSMLGTRLLITLGFIAFMPAAEVQAAEVSPAAQSSCMAAVNNQYGGSVRDLKIVSSEFSQANSVVMVKAIGIRGSNQSENWKCLVSNQGTVADLSVVSGGATVAPAKQPASSAAQSTCMAAVNRNYGGNVRELKVVSSTSTKPNFEVIVKAIGVRGTATNERWRCIGKGATTVTDLSVIER